MDQIEINSRKKRRYFLFC